MGPYMRPIPVGASAAMIFSLIVAFIVTPWAHGCSAAQAAGTVAAHDADGRARSRASIGASWARCSASRPGAGHLFWPASSCCCSARWRSSPVEVGARQDAAVRQQERVPGRRGHARGDDRSSRRTASRRRSPTRSATQPEVTTYQTYVGTAGALQLQRPRASLLPAAGVERRPTSR